MSEGFRGLVVDDDAVSQQITLHALAQAGITCDAASSGSIARQLCEFNQYDIVVTDLQMPNGNGHALCVDLLQQRRRPIILVVSGITDPRISRDLLVRGVDDVIYKPLDFQLFIAKVEALLTRRKASLNPGEAGGQLCDSLPRDVELGLSVAAIRRLSSPELEGKIAIMASLLPISSAATDVAKLTSSSDTDMHLIAETIKRDPALAAELLRLANSPFYNPTNSKLLDIEEAVIRIGTKRIGELAMATAALSGLTQSRLPWLDVTRVGRQSIAAGIAVNRLCQQAGLTMESDGLFLSALMSELGRIVLGTVFTEEYKAMVAACEQTGTSLVDQEVRIFPTQHADVAARLLSMWKVPASVCQPLKHLADSYYQLEQVQEPLRTKTELVKIAVLVGNLAVGGWEPWQLVEIPPVPVLARLNLAGIEELLIKVKQELQEAIKSLSGHLRMKGPVTGASRTARSPRELPYCRLAPTRFDFLAEVIGEGAQLLHYAPEELNSLDSIVINCLGVPPSRLCEYLADTPVAQRRLILTDAQRASEYASLGTPLGLPCSYRTLKEACSEFSNGRSRANSAASTNPARL